MSLVGNAQTRVTLHEEFTGENCGPCAATNPGFWSLCDSAPNVTRLIHIAYMSPIPSAGVFYYQDQATTDTRITYYSVPFAPYGRYDGAVPDPGCSGGSSAGHPACFTEADIDAEAAIASPFNMSVTNAWNATYDSIVTTVNVTCVTAYSGTNIYLRSALVETVDWNPAPGSNGETHFENVVRSMYPDATGTSVGSWTVGETHTYTFSVPVPSYVDKSGSPYMVCWIQRDDDKNIAQAGKGSPLPGVPNDASLTASHGPAGLICHADGTYVLNHTVDIKNAGTATMTSATIYYSVDGGAMSSTNWTGTLAAGGTATGFAMPSINVTVAGAAFHTIYDSIANPNGVADQNSNNNAAGGSFFIESTNAVAMPFSTSFETNLGEFYSLNLATDGSSWGMYNDAGSGSLWAHTGTYAAMYYCYNFPSGDASILTMPEVTTSSPSAVDFYVAYAQYAGTENDKLEVVYSTDCGTSWTSLWSQAGSALSTASATTSVFIPTASEYKEIGVNLNTVPAGSIIGFRATSDYGNCIWLDDVNIHTGFASGVAQVTAANLGATIYPNPANDQATLTFNLATAKNVQVEVVDQLGRTVSQVANETLDAGAHSFTINTSDLAAGVYNVVMHTEDGTFNERLSVVK